MAIITISLAYWKFDNGVSLEHGKTCFIFFGSFLGLVLFGINRPQKNFGAVALPTFLLLIIAFYGLYSLGSVASLIQFLYFSVAILVLNQLSIGQYSQSAINYFKTLVSISGALISWSILIDVLYSYAGNTGSVFFTYGPPAHGLLGNRGYSGMYIALCFFFSGKTNKLLGLLALLYIATNGTVTPLASVLIVEGFTLSKKLIKDYGLRTILAPLFLCSIVLVVNPFKINFNDDMSVRSQVWQKSLRAVSKRPLFGYGLGFFSDANHEQFEKYTPMTFRSWEEGEFFLDLKKINAYIPLLQMHNEYLEALFSFGIIGSLLLLYILIKALRSKMPDQSFHKALYALMIISLFWFPFHIASVCLLSIMIISLLINYNQTGESHA